MSDLQKAQACDNASTWIAWFVCLDVEIQAALIGAACTVLIGVIGYYVVFRQINIQARRALFVDVYKDFQAVVAVASRSEGKFSGVLQRASFELGIYRANLAQGHHQFPPTITIREITDAMYDMRQGVSGVLGATERWRIVEPKQEMFAAALWDDLEDISDAWDRFWPKIGGLLAHDKDSKGILTPENAAAIASDILKKIEVFLPVLDDLQGVSFNLMGHLIDIENEMQNLLLGGLFRHPPVRRKDVGPGVVVLRFDRFDALMKQSQEKRAHRKRAQRKPLS